MRPIVWCVLLLIVASVPGWGQSAANGSGAAAGREAAEIRASADKLIASGVPDDVAKGAALLEKASAIEQAQINAEKTATEQQKLQKELDDEQSSRWKSFATNLAPLVTTIVLAGTLIFQILQSRAERHEKSLERIVEAKNTAKDDFTDALKNTQLLEGISPAAAWINSITEEPYRSAARKLGTKLMMRAKTFDDFQDLFGELMDPVTPDKMEELMKLSRGLDTIYNPKKPELVPLWDKRQKGLELKPEDLVKLEVGDRLEQEQGLLSQRLGSLLRGRAAGDAAPDLHAIGLTNVDLSGCDLRGANIAMTAWNWVNLDDCDMSGITEFQFSAFYSTAWWHVSAMSAGLLEHLKANYAYAPGQNCWSKIPVSAEEYAASIARLAEGRPGFPAGGPDLVVEGTVQS
jgi:hypothetical protein